LVVLPAVNRERIQPTDFDHASRLIAPQPSSGRGTRTVGPGQRLRMRPRGCDSR
jgi:hypothetical protein